MTPKLERMGYLLLFLGVWAMVVCAHTDSRLMLVISSMDMAVGGAIILCLARPGGKE